MPVTNAFGNKVDSGAFPDTFDRALARADVAGFAARRSESEAKGLLRGLGFAYHIKATGGSPSENVDIRFEADGTVSLITGTQTIGQGHETTFPQILAERLGLPNERIRLVQGDTDLIPGRRRARQLARDLYGRHGDLACFRRDHRQGDPHRRRGAGSGRGRHPLRGGQLSSSRGRTAGCRCSMSPRSGATRACRSTPIITGRGNG